VRAAQPRVIVQVLGQGIFLEKLVDGREKLHGFLQLVLVLWVHTYRPELIGIYENRRVLGRDSKGLSLHIKVVLRQCALVVAHASLMALVEPSGVCLHPGGIHRQSGSVPGPIFHLPLPAHAIYRGSGGQMKCAATVITVKDFHVGVIRTLGFLIWFLLIPAQIVIFEALFKH
jgi:hypothetical protein